MRTASAITAGTHRQAAYGVARLPATSKVGTDPLMSETSGVRDRTSSQIACKPAAMLATIHNPNNACIPHHAPSTANTLTSAAPIMFNAKNGISATSPTPAPIIACATDTPNGAFNTSAQINAATRPAITSELGIRRARQSHIVTAKAQTINKRKAVSNFMSHPTGMTSRYEPHSQTVSVLTLQLDILIGKRNDRLPNQEIFRTSLPVSP